MTFSSDFIDPADSAPQVAQKATPRKARGWSRSAVNFALDCFLLLAFLCMLWMTLLIRFIFPSPSEATNWSLWGWEYATWVEFQFSAIVIFGVLVLIHLVLHWTWVCGFITGRLAKRFNISARLTESTRTLYGVTTLIVVMTFMGALLLWADFAIRHPSP